MLRSGYSSGSEMVSSSIKVVGSASGRLSACTMPRIGSRAALALEQQEAAPRRLERQHSGHVASSRAPSGAMLKEAVRVCPCVAAQ